jgi:DNA-binding MarR family transcriptional regulator
MIDRLEQKGLVRRVPNAEDRRAANVELTLLEGRSIRT